MAARKRASRTRGDSTSPNTVLVVFLVIFILATFGLGGWVWSMFERVRTAEGKARDAETAKAAANRAEEWAKLQASELRVMLGDPVYKEEKSSELNDWKVAREKFVKVSDKGVWEYTEDGEFKGAAYLDSFKKWM
jgi:hypothetical protein